MDPQKLVGLLPGSVQQRLLACIEPVPAPARTAAGILGALGLLYLTNNALNSVALGNSARLQWDWRKEIVLVTGGCSGLGELVVRKLAKRSVKVVVVDLQAPKTPLPSNVWFFKLDVTSTEDIKHVAQEIRKQVGDPTVLVNNAGIGYAKDILKSTDDEIRRTFDVNIVAHFFLVREFLPFMIEKDHGHVITIASMASFATIASNTDYSCTKAAALAFHEGLTQELKYRYSAPRVRTSIIHPSWVRTPLIEPLIETGRFTDSVLEPEYVADAIVRQVIGGKSGQVILPGTLSLLSSLRGFPAWLQHLLRSSQADLLRIAEGLGRPRT
ncbi:putative short-chain dehydrogenase/reductase 2 [Sarocladium strictum]